MTARRRDVRGRLSPYAGSVRVAGRPGGDEAAVAS